MMDQYRLGDDKKNEEEKPSLKGDLLLEHRKVFLFGEINQKKSQEVCEKLLYLNEVDHNKPIVLFINSQGGHVEAGDSLHDLIRFINARVIVVGSGFVASAGTHIYLAAEKEDRYALPNTRFMIHQPSGGGYGSASDIRIQMEEIVKMKLRISKVIADQTGQPLEKVKQDVERDYWMTAEEAKDYGVVCQIAKSEKEILL